MTVTTAYGKSFTVDGFSWWMEARGYPGGRTASRLQAAWPTESRRTFARRSKRNGEDDQVCPPHTTLAKAERYTEDADQAGLAEDAVIKLIVRLNAESCRMAGSNRGDATSQISFSGGSLEGNISICRHRIRALSARLADANASAPNLWHSAAFIFGIQAQKLHGTALAEQRAGS